MQKTATYSCVFKSHPQSAQTLSIDQVSKYCLIAPFSKQHFAVARLTGRTTPLKPFSVHTRILASFALKELNNKFQFAIMKLSVCVRQQTLTGIALQQFCFAASRASQKSLELAAGVNLAARRLLELHCENYKAQRLYKLQTKTSNV